MPAVFTVVFVQFLGLNRIDVLGVNELISSLEKREKAREAVFSGNALKARMLNVVFNAKSFRARRITTQNTRFTLNNP